MGIIILTEVISGLEKVGRCVLRALQPCNWQLTLIKKSKNLAAKFINMHQITSSFSLEKGENRGKIKTYRAVTRGRAWEGGGGMPPVFPPNFETTDAS